MHESIQKCVVIVGFSLIPLVCCVVILPADVVVSPVQHDEEEALVAANAKNSTTMNNGRQAEEAIPHDTHCLMVFGVGVTACKLELDGKKSFFVLHDILLSSTVNTQQQQQIVSTIKKKLTDAVIVENVEHERRRSHELEEWCECHTSWLDEFVLPAPPGTANTGGKRLWALVATSQPTAQFAQFHLSQWHIGCNANKEKYKKLVVIHGWLGIDG